MERRRRKVSDVDGSKPPLLSNHIILHLAITISWKWWRFYILTSEWKMYVIKTWQTPWMEELYLFSSLFVPKQDSFYCCSCCSVISPKKKKKICLRFIAAEQKPSHSLKIGSNVEFYPFSYSHSDFNCGVRFSQESNMSPNRSRKP